MDALTETSVATALFAEGTSEGLTSSEIAAIAARGGDELDGIRSKIAAARETARDPAVSGARVTELNSEAESLQLESDRLETAIARLDARAGALRVEEEDRPKVDRYEAAALAIAAADTAIRERYPALAREIAELLTAAAAADRLAIAASADLPRGRGALQRSAIFLNLRPPHASFGGLTLPGLEYRGANFWPPVGR